MILRKPNFQDVYKAIQLLSENEEEQKQILQDWLNQSKNNEHFFNYVIVKDHNVLALVTGSAIEKLITIGYIHGSIKLKQTLFNKILKQYNPEVVTLNTNEIDGFVEEFKVDSYNLVWMKPQSEETEVNVVTETEEVNTEDVKESEGING